MPRRRYILLALLVTAIIAGVLASRLYDAGEPRYQGKKLSAWTALYMRGGDRVLASQQQCDRVDEAVRHMGTNAIPFLLEWYAYDRVPHMKRADTVYTHLPRTMRTNVSVIRLLYADRKEHRSVCAIYALAALDPQTLSSNPAFLRFVRNTNTFGEWYRADRLIDAIATIRAQAAASATNAPSQ